MELITTIVVISLILSFTAIVTVLLVHLYYASRWSKSKALSEECATLSNQYNALLSHQQSSEQFFDKWFSHLASPIYANEAEVTAKCVFPLLLLLGSDLSNVRFHVPVHLNLHTQDLNGVADCVLMRSDEDSFQPRSHMIIEAKAPSVELSPEVIAEARAIAYALDAPLYLVTNGKQLRIYKRGIQTDEKAIHIPIQDLGTTLDAIAEVLGLTQPEDSIETLPSPTPEEDN